MVGRSSAKPPSATRAYSASVGIRPAKMIAARRSVLRQGGHLHGVEEGLWREGHRAHVLAEEREEALHVGELRRALRHLDSAAVRHALDLVEDQVRGAFHRVEKVAQHVKVA